jgi:D-glycero-D-manno-heptose 1,7-bisphosphate phosphatase
MAAVERPTRRAVFLDLNGTLVLPILVDHLSQLAPIDDAPTAVAALSAAGFVCPVVTIQSRIAKGLFSADEFHGWFQRFAADFAGHGATIIGPYVCPHRFAVACRCKKPSTFLYEQAAAEHGLDLRRSFVIGDSAADVEAASRFGGRGCLVRTGWGANDGEVQRATPYASHVAHSLTEAVAWVLGQS